MIKREPEEIKAELKALRAIKPHIPHYDRYGVNQWDMVGAMVKTLVEGYTRGEIRARWKNGDVYSAAEDALYWANGGDIPSPSESWKSVAARVTESA